jgi:hypothetical protein
MGWIGWGNAAEARRQVEKQTKIKEAGKSNGHQTSELAGLEEQEQSG